VTIIVELPGLDAGNVCGHSLWPTGTNMACLPCSSRTGTAMSATSNPHGLEHAVSSRHPGLPGAQPVLRAGQKELVELAGPDAPRILELMPQMPTLVWARDELKAGEIWNRESDVPSRHETHMKATCHIPTPTLNSPRARIGAQLSRSLGCA
jgi:hypothetical protein